MLQKMSIVLCLCAGPVFSQDACVTADALKSGGIAVTVKGGSVQTYRAKGRDVVATVPVLSAGEGFVAEMLLAQGIFVISDHRIEHEAAADLPEGAVMVGGNDGGTTTTLYRYASLPKPGKSWQGKVTVTRDQDGPSIGPQPTIKGKVATTVSFLPEETVTISGCDYRIQPVETAMTVTADSRFTVGGERDDGIAGAPDQLLLGRRQIWFPDLGFAVTTRERGADSGWSDDWGQGIIGLAAN